jgi:hypothetical protein
MNDISPNAIFLSSAFEPSPDELRAYARSEKDRSRPVEDRKPSLLAAPKSKPLAPRRPPPTELVELSSDEEMPDFSEILSGTKKEGGHRFSIRAHAWQLKGICRERKGKCPWGCMFPHKSPDVKP